MAKAAKKPASKISKRLKKEVEGTLIEIFSDIKDAVGEKKFSKKVRKAGKILSAGASMKKEKKEKTKKGTPKVAKGVKIALALKKAAKPAAKKTKKQPKATKLPPVPTPDQPTT